MNTLTVKRHQRALSDMITDIMRNENLSLLEACTKLASMATSDEVVERAKKKIEYINNQGWE